VTGVTKTDRQVHQPKKKWKKESDEVVDINIDTNETISQWLTTTQMD
jgi:predicted XRE-type DNA-binding protein